MAATAFFIALWYCWYPLQARQAREGVFSKAQTQRRCTSPCPRHQPPVESPNTVWCRGMMLRHAMCA